MRVSGAYQIESLVVFYWGRMVWLFIVWGVAISLVAVFPVLPVSIVGIALIVCATGLYIAVVPSGVGPVARAIRPLAMSVADMRADLVKLQDRVAAIDRRTGMK